MQIKRRGRKRVVWIKMKNCWIEGLKGLRKMKIKKRKKANNDNCCCNYCCHIYCCCFFRVVRQRPMTTTSGSGFSWWKTVVQSRVRGGCEFSENIWTSKKSARIAERGRERKGVSVFWDFPLCLRILKIKCNGRGKPKKIGKTSKK